MNDKRHFHLYARGWYKKSDNVLEDLKKIYDHYMGHDLGKDHDVMGYLLHLVAPYVDSERLFVEFINDMHPSNAWIIGCEREGLFEPTKEPYDLRVVRKCLSFLKFVPLEKIDIELGEPDSSILEPFKR